MRENVELRQGERGDPVQAHRVAERDEIEPAAAAFAAGDRAELATEFTHTLLIGAFDLRRERPFPDPSHISLRDTDHAVDPVRADADARRRVCRDRVRGRDEWIRAVVEVEQGPLCALEQDLAPFVQRLVHEERRVRHIRPNSLRERLELPRDLFQVERRNTVDALEPDVLLRERDLDLLPKDLRLEEVLDADTEPCRLVGIAGTDTALRCADLQLAETPLARLVDRDVPRHDQVCLAGEVHDSGGDIA